jgi:TRAP-type mannitol/chloroaromatic compound transport system permease large subunit
MTPHPRRLGAGGGPRPAKIYRGTLRFLAADFVLVGLLVSFPALALWLPAKIGM